MQFFDNLKTSYLSLPDDTRRILLILGAIGGGLVMLFGILVIIFLTPRQQSITGTNETPEVTKTPEEIAVMTLAPPAPTDIPFISKEDIVAILPQLTPTPTALPGQFYIPNGQQNDLEIRYAYFDEGDTFEEVRIKNNKTREERPIGFKYRFSPGNSAFFSKDFSQVIYIGGTKIDYNKITIYSIPKNSNVKYITPDHVKQALPQLQTSPTAILSRLVASPDKTRVAVSYGNTFDTNRITTDTQIIIIRLVDNKMQLLPVKGLVKGWANDTTLQYEVNTTTQGVNNTLESPISL